MKKFSLFLALILCANLSIWGAVTYERLESVADIDGTAQYVLGIDGTGFHYSGTSSWGLVNLPSKQTPLYYTLTKATTGSTFSAKTTIEGEIYYLNIPTSNTFTMQSSAVQITLGTTTSDTNGAPEYAVTNKDTKTRHLRINGTSGLRSYATTTGSMAYFYKVVISEDIKVTSVSVTPTSAEIMVGKTLQLTATVSPDNATNKAVSWSSNNDKVTVSETGLVTVVADATVGSTATITATTEDGNYTATCAVIVIENPYIFYESFDTNEGTGGNDDKWSGSIASSDLESDNKGWNFESGKGAKACAKFGSGSKKGSAKTPSISYTGAAKLIFKAAAWNGSNEGTTLNLSATSGTLSSSSVTLKKGAWTEYEINISGIESSTQITFEAANESNNRFFLDEVQLIKVIPQPEISLYFKETETTYEAGTEIVLGSVGYKEAGTTYNYKHLYVKAENIEDVTKLSWRIESIEGNENPFEINSATSTSLFAPEEGYAGSIRIDYTVTIDATEVDNPNPKTYKANLVLLYVDNNNDKHVWDFPISLTTDKDSSPTTSLDNATISDNVRKVMRDGKIFIIRDGITYSVDGRVVE